MFKYASATLYDPRIAQSGDHRRRTAHRVEFEYTPREGYLYVRSRMISSRCNDNFDEFTPEEIKGDGKTLGYVTFVGKPVFVNHHNEDHRRARGIILDAKLHEDRNADGSPDTWVEGLMEVDAIRFPKLAKAILAGEIDRTSMGVDVERSQCSKCANVATTPLEYCRHIPAMKGTRIRMVTASGQPTQHLVRERCFGLRFFENSLLVEEPADPTAYFLGSPVQGPKLASHTASRREPPKENSTMQIKVGMRRCAVCFSANTVDMAGLTECTDCGQIRPLGQLFEFGAASTPAQDPTDEHPGGPEPKKYSFSVKEHPDPSTHPIWNDIGASHHNIVAEHDDARPHEYDDGKRWYPDSQLLAHHLGQSTGHGITKAAGVLSALSPKMEWGNNIHHAVRSLHQGTGVTQGPANPGVMQMHTDNVNKILSGVHPSVALKGPKTNNFHHNIEHGGMDPETGGHSDRVTVDTHAVSVMCGRRLSKDEKANVNKALGNPHFYKHAVNLYKQATDHVNERDGTDLGPTQMQAITWGVRKRKNDEDAEYKNKAQQTMERNNRTNRQDMLKNEFPEHAEYQSHSSDPTQPKNLHAKRKRQPSTRQGGGRPFR